MIVEVFVDKQRLAKEERKFTLRNQVLREVKAMCLRFDYRRNIVINHLSPENINFEEILNYIDYH